MDYNLNSPINTLCSVSTPSIFTAQRNRPQPSLFKSRSLTIVIHDVELPTTANNIVLDTRHPGIDMDPISLPNNQFHITYTIPHDKITYVR